VCGVERVANPEHEAAKARVTEAERRTRRAERELDLARRQVSRAKQDTSVTAAALSVISAQEQVAEREWISCRKNQKVGGKDCSVEHNRLDRVESAKKLAASRDNEAKAALARIETDVSDAKTNVSRARTYWDQTVSSLSRTPLSMNVDRICPLTYGAEIHAFTFSTALSLTAQVMGTASPIHLPSKALQMTAMDDTFAAFPGRCYEVAAGNPLNVGRIHRGRARESRGRADS
jgi:multidrug efflux pump subunit AcrA (membrane-fusion protein)